MLRKLHLLFRNLKIIRKHYNTSPQKFTILTNVTNAISVGINPAGQSHVFLLEHNFFLNFLENKGGGFFQFLAPAGGFNPAMP